VKAARSSGAALSPWEVALLIAVGGHGAALAIAWQTSLGVPLFAEKAFVAPVEPFEASVFVVDALPREGSDERPTTAGAAANAAAIEPQAPGHAARGERGAPTSEPSGAPGDAEGPRGSSEYDPLPGGAAVGLPGLGGVPAWSVPGVLTPLPRAAPAPTTIPRTPIDPDAAGRAIRGTLDARDQERGMSLPAANETARAIEAVVASAETSGESRATFSVELDASGNVKSVALSRATSGDASVWAAVVARIRAALAGRRLTMRGDAARLGAIVSVEVVTRDRFPDGARGSGATNAWGEHRTRTVLSRARVLVAGAKPLPEDYKPIVIQPFFTPPDPKKSGVVPMTPGDDYRRHTPQE
jgi:hypothetical protein